MAFGSTRGAILSLKSNRSALKKVSKGNLKDPSFDKTDRQLEYKKLSDLEIEPILQKIRDKKAKQNKLRTAVIIGFSVITALMIIYINLG